MVSEARSMIAMIIAVLMFCAGPGASAQDRATGESSAVQKQIVTVRMSDGVEIALALYLPRGSGAVPALLAASPYRIDNDEAPSVPIFPFRETGPIAWYVEHGYAYVRMDVRGTGRSGGEYRYQDNREQRDLYEIVEWIASQGWSNGRVGGVGQSYYARSQWFMAIQSPPHLACIAPYDGNIDTYNASAFQGGIPGAYPHFWFNYVRGLNLYPFAGKPRDLPWDYTYEIGKHPLFDEFWRERTAAGKLGAVRIPVFSIGVWGKVDLHLNGNITGYQQVAGPKKLLVLGGSGVDAASAEYSSTAFHERYLLPFYDWCLKGVTTSYVSEPEVRYTVTGSNRILTAASWPPPNAEYKTFYLSAQPSRCVTSLNDGTLATEPPKTDGGQTSFHYPNPGWTLAAGVASRAPDGSLDTARRVLTFTTAPFADDVTIAGPILLRAHITSTRDDADFFVKLYEQSAQSDELVQKGTQPKARFLTKGWLRASHRAIDPKMSRPNAPWYAHQSPQPLTPNQAYFLDIAIMPTAATVHRGNRIRLEIANSDSLQIESIFSHSYFPDQVGSYTILHDSEHASQLLIPFVPEDGR